MTKYGYVAYTLQVRRRSRKQEPLPFRHFDGDQDALVLLYGALAGLREQALHENNRYLKTKKLEATGRSVRFGVDVGHSGQSSQFIDPDQGDTPVFLRDDHHIEAGLRRGMIVAPSAANIGLLLLEVHGRSGAKSMLAPVLKRMFAATTGYVLDIESVTHQAALEKFISQAKTKAVTLRRNGLPSDVADAVRVSANDAGLGKMELRITPGRTKRFQQDLVSKLRGDIGARQRLLRLGELEFDEISVGMEIGDRNTTLTVTADQTPTFIYSVPGSSYPTDKDFFEELLKVAGELAPVIGMSVGTGWDAGDWSQEALATVLPVAQEAPRYEHGQQDQ